MRFQSKFALSLLLVVFLTTDTVLSKTVKKNKKGSKPQADEHAESTAKPEATEKTPTQPQENLVPEIPLNPYVCDQYQGYKGLRTDELDNCCNKFAKGSFECTTEPQPGHLCTSYHPPVCCKCTHLPPPPKNRQPVGPPKKKPVSTGGGDAEDSEEDDDELESQ